MNEELQAKLAAMADALGVKAEALFQVLVQEQVRSGWVLVASLLPLAIIFGVAGAIFAKKAHGCKSYSASDAYGAAAFVSCIIGFSFLVAVLATAPERILCPTKGAIQGLLK